MPKINKKYLLAGIIVLIIAAFWWNKSNQPTAKINETITAEVKTITQEVSVTGKIKPAEQIDLAFEKSGKIASANVIIGSAVTKGMVLATLESKDINAQLAQAQAALDAELSKLNQLKQGTRPEEIKIAETAVFSAQQALADAQSNLGNINTKAAADINQTYDSAITSADSSISVATNSMIVLTNIQFSLFAVSNPTSQDTLNNTNLANAKAAAILALLGAQNAGQMDTNSINQLSGGAKAAVNNARVNPTDQNTGLALTQTKNALEKVKTALETVPINSNLTSTQVTSLNTEKTNINTEIADTATKENAIAAQKVTNNNAISTAQTSVNVANNALSSAKDNLALKKAGSTPEQIATQAASVKQSQANVQNIQSQLAKTILASPINGIVTKQDAKIGEIISANTTLVSLISEAKFQIETNIPEADIAKIKINDPAAVTLDAYGTDVPFEAKVISVDPAETVIEGVSTYKTTLEFTKEDDHIKSGMTANIDILTAQKENVIALPQRTIINRDGQKSVLVDKGNNQTEERKIETGLRGSDGNIEIISGLSAGEKVVISVTQ